MWCSRCRTARRKYLSLARLRLAPVLVLLSVFSVCVYTYIVYSGGHSPTEVDNIPRQLLRTERNLIKENLGPRSQRNIQDQSSQMQFSSIHSHNPADTSHTANYISRYGYEWLKESTDGLLCQHDTQGLCGNEHECKHLSYLWQMAQLYISFHSRGVQQLMKGHSDSVRTLTWYCQVRSAKDCVNVTDCGGNVCGGLGYQFKGITLTWVLGMLTGRVILLKWQGESAVNKYLLPHMIDWKYHDYTLKGSSVDLGNYELFRASVGRAKAKIKYGRNLLKALTSNITHVQMHFNLLNCINIYMASKQFKLPCGQIPGIKLPPEGQFLLGFTEFVAVKILFKFSDQLKSYLYYIQSQIANVTHGKKYIAVHLRTGVFDDLHEFMAKYRTARSKEDWTKAIDCATMQADKHIGSDSTILLVSDSGKTKHLISKEYPRVKIFENKIIHVDKHTNVTEEGMLGIWQDIAILAQSQVLLEHGSSFSDVAVALCGIPPSRRINFVKC